MKVYIATKEVPVPESRVDQGCVYTEILGVASNEVIAQGFIHQAEDLLRRLAEKEQYDSAEEMEPGAEYYIQEVTLNSPTDYWTLSVAKEMGLVNGDEN